MERLLVTGSAGQLGRDLVRRAEDAGNTVIGLGRERFDLVVDDLVSIVTDARPTVVFNCAAYTAVDAAESDEVSAFAVNDHGVRRLAEACYTAGAHLVHLSTDYVFDGALDRPYVETDPTGPRSVYGRSKLAGEGAAVDVLGGSATIVRTSWVCGDHGKNIVKLVLRLAADPKQQLSFVDDQVGHPTFTRDLADALLHVAGERPGGIFHVTNRREVSWFGFVREILAASGHNPERVRPITTSELDPPGLATRPANSRLANARWDAADWAPTRDFGAPLREMLARLT